jgi:hypothetical protein
MLGRLEYIYNNLSKNKNAIYLLENNLDKVDCLNLSQNKNAIHILENNLDKINWERLCLNSNALHLLFKLDYKKMKINNLLLKQELLEIVMKLERLNRFYEEYNVKLDYYDFIDLYG